MKKATKKKAVPAQSSAPAVTPPARRSRSKGKVIDVATIPIESGRLTSDSATTVFKEPNVTITEQQPLPDYAIAMGNALVAQLGTITPASIETVRIKVAKLSEHVQTLTISDSVSSAVAASELTTIVTIRKKIEEYHTPIKKAAYEAHKAATASESSDLTAIAQAEIYLRRLIGDWEVEQRRLQTLKVEQQRIEDETRRQQELAQAQSAAEEKTFLQIEQLMLTQNMTYEEAVAAVNPVRQVELAKEAVPQSRTVVPAYKPDVPLTTTYSCKIVNIKELCGAVYRGEYSDMCVEGNQAILNGLARTLKEAFRVPGCELVIDNGVRVKT